MKLANISFFDSLCQQSTVSVFNVGAREKFIPLIEIQRGLDCCAECLKVITPSGADPNADITTQYPPKVIYDEIMSAVSKYEQERSRLASAIEQLITSNQMDAGDIEFFTKELPASLRVALHDTMMKSPLYRALVEQGYDPSQDGASANLDPNVLDMSAMGLGQPMQQQPQQPQQPMQSTPQPGSVPISPNITSDYVEAY